MKNENLSIALMSMLQLPSSDLLKKAKTHLKTILSTQILIVEKIEKATGTGITLHFN